MAIKCLMLESGSKRFFTMVKNRAHLKEYCQTFKAKMTVVYAEIEKNKIMDLEKLIPALCDKNHKGQKIKFKKANVSTRQAFHSDSDSPKR